MNLFIESHQQLIKKLIEHSVDFIIIGGYSVIFHGYKRTTGDVDIWIKPTNENKLKLISALEHFNFDKDEINEIAAMDFSKHLTLSIGDPPEKIDFITYINIVKYEEADAQKIIANVDGLNIPFLHLNHLILSKINTGRGKDSADVEELQRIERARKK